MLIKNPGILLFIVIALQSLIFQDSVAGADSSSCPKRTDYDSRCKKKCVSDSQCKNRKNRVKKCLCDGVCGLSCIRIGQKCREESSVVTKLKRGFVKLNGRPYKTKSFNFGDEITYSCKKGFTLLGPSKLKCSGIGKWKPWDQGKPSCSEFVDFDWLGLARQCKNLGPLKDGRVFGSSREVGGKLRFRCNPGYEQHGPSELTCLRNLRWSGDKPKCRVRSCKEPQVPKNGRISRGKQISYQYGDIVYFSCNPGYSRIGSSAAVCYLDGWRSRGTSFAKCAPKSCRLPPDISNGQVEGTVFTYKNVIKYTCNKGYETTRGNTYRRCLENQRWSGIEPQCERVDCGRFQDVPNGSVESYGTRYGDRQRITCSVGYKLNGPEEVTCEGNGMWSSLPKCELVTCDPSYNSLRNGIVTGRQVVSTCNNTYNCRLEFKCLDGYYLQPDINNAVCLVSGLWSKLKPTCKAKDCGYPTVPQFGRLTDDSDNFLYPSMIQYECYQNYVLFGGKTRSCQADAKWSSNEPTCRADCGQPFRPKNGTMHGRSFFEGDRVNFKCDRGFDIEGHASITCIQSTAQWSQPSPKCKPKSCGFPLFPQYGYHKAGVGEYYYPSIIQYGCNQNYILYGAKTSSCQSDGKWSNSVPTCRAKCPKPVKPTNGNVRGNSFLNGDRVDFACDEGYYIDGEASITCLQETAQWSHRAPQCKPKDCGKPKELARGNFVGQPSFFYPSVVRYECQDKYIMRGEPEIKCKANGQWNQAAPSCIANCTDPGSLSHGRKIGSSFLANDEVKFECTHGYQLIGAQSIKCRQYDALWSDRKPICKIAECPDPTGMVQNGVANWQERIFESAVSFKCNEGYELDGAKILTCGANGNWDNVFPTCKGISCVAPEDLANGFRVQQLGVYSYPSEIEYKCSDGFELSGSNKIQCQTSGNWNKLKATCEEIVCNGTHSIQHGSIDLSKAVMNDDNMHEYQSEITYSCNSGYELRGDPISRCDGMNKWSGTVPKCTPVDCRQPSVPNSLVHGTQTVYSSTVKISCKNGYSRTKTLGDSVCQANGKWSNLPKCNVVDCKQPLIANAMFDAVIATTFGSVLKISCQKGFALNKNDGDEIRCLPNGNWSALPRCKEITCDKPLDIANGKIDESRSLFTKDGRHKYNSRVAYVCNTGFLLNGDRESNCGRDGWTGNLRACTAIVKETCNKPLGMKSGAIKDEQINMQATLAGYNGKGRLGGKTWCGSFEPYNNEVAVQIQFNSVMHIKNVTFQAVENILRNFEARKVFFRYFDATNENGVFRHTKDYGINIPAGGVFNVDIFEPIKTSYFEVVIKKTDRYSSVCSRFEIHGCEVQLTCGIPKLNPENGETLGMIYKEGDKAIYSCDSGYKLESDDKQTCLSNGSWSGKIPRCIKVDTYKGCFKDKTITLSRYPHRVLNTWKSVYFSPRECIESCEETRDITVAGLQYSTQCFCGYERNLKELETDNKDCYIPCNKDLSRKCGGPWRNSVYRVN
eukprot:gene16184-17811_t